MSTRIESADNCIIINGVLYPKGVLRACIEGNLLNVWEDLERTIPLINSVPYSDIIHVNAGAAFTSINTLTDFVKEHFFFKRIKNLSELINDVGYLTSETDPTVPGHVKAITTTNISHWNTAYAWGNHAGLYPLLSGSYDNPTWINSLAWSKITGKPTSLSGYGITDAYTQTQINNFFSGTTAVSGYNKANWDAAYATSLNVFLQNGNSFGGAAVLGTNDNYGINIKTNGVVRLAIPSTGIPSAAGNVLTLNGTTLSSQTPAQIASTAGAFMYNGTIPGAADLNTYTTTGFYLQPSNTNAQSGVNYPTGKAGILNVEYASSIHILQRYTTYQASSIQPDGTWFRYQYNGAWTAWRRVWSNGDFTTTDIANWNTAYSWNNHAGLYIRTQATLLLDASKNFGVSVKGIEQYLVSSGFSNYPTLGQAIEFSSGIGNNASGWGRDFTIFKDSATGNNKNFYLRAYNTSTGASLGFDRIWHSGDFTSTDISKWTSAFPTSFLNTLNSATYTGDLLTSPVGSYSALVSTSATNRPFTNVGGLISFGSSVSNASTRILGARDNSDNLWFQSGDGTGAWRQLASRDWVTAQGYGSASSVSGTTGFLPKFTSSTAVGNSLLIESGSMVYLNSSTGQLGVNQGYNRFFSNQASVTGNGIGINLYHTGGSGGTWQHHSTTGYSGSGTAIQIAPGGGVQFIAASGGTTPATITTIFNINNAGNLLNTGTITAGSIPTLGIAATTVLTHTGGLLQSRTIAQIIGDAATTLDASYFKLGGNSYGTTAYIGTNDNWALAFKTNGVLRGGFGGGTHNGNFYLGTAGASNNISFYNTSQITGAASSYANYTNAEVQSGVTSFALGYRSTLSTQAAPFTLGSMIHYRATQGTIGAGSSVTNQIGYWADDMPGSTNSYGFYSLMAAGTNKYNLYMGGTASNYLAGTTLVGSSTDNGIDKLQVTGSIATNSSLKLQSEYFANSVYNYANGILVTTDIVAGAPVTMFELYITGNSYGGTLPVNTQIQGYSYSTPLLINCKGLNYGIPIPSVDIFADANNFICFWLSQPAGNSTLRFRLGLGTNVSKRITSITNVTRPTGTTLDVTVTPVNIQTTQINGTGFVKATGTTLSYDNSTYLPTLTGSATGNTVGTGTGDLNNLLSGWTYANGAANRPSNTNSFVFSMGFAGYTGQIALRLNNMWFRTQENSVWGSWNYMWTNKDFTSIDIANWNTSLFFRGAIPNAADLDTYISQGNWSINATAGPTLINSPYTGSQTSSLEVVVSGSYITQRFTITGSTLQGSVYVRVKNSTNAWSAWKLQWSELNFASTDITNWNSAYNNRITSLTTTGTGGTAALASNILNIPVIPAQYNPTQGTGITITGTYPNHTIAATNTNALWNANQLQGVSVHNAAPTNGQILAYNSANTRWEPTTPPAYITLTALSGTAPITYNNTTGAIGITQATTSTNGYLSSTDWNTFNNKQTALNGTGFVKIAGTTISYDNTAYLALTGGSVTGITGIGGTANTNQMLLVRPNLANRRGLTIQALSGQTGNLQEWQNNSSGLLSYINASGQANFATGSYSTGGYSLLVKNDTTGVHESIAASVYQIALSGNGMLAYSGTTPAYIAGTAGQLLRRNATNTAYEFFTPNYLTGINGNEGHLLGRYLGDGNGPAEDINLPTQFFIWNNGQYTSEYGPSLNTYWERHDENHKLIRPFKIAVAPEEEGHETHYVEGVDLRTNRLHLEADFKTNTTGGSYYEVQLTDNVITNINGTDLTIALPDPGDDAQHGRQLKFRQMNTHSRLYFANSEGGSYYVYDYMDGTIHYGVTYLSYNPSGGIGEGYEWVEVISMEVPERGWEWVIIQQGGSLEFSQSRIGLI